MNTLTDPKARSEQLIRRPVEEVFTAFVQPDKLVHFWLANASAPLRPGRKVRWEFMVKGAVDEVEVLALEPNQLIRIRSADGTVTEWKFKSSSPQETIVSIQQTGFSGKAEVAMENAIEATQGYTVVLSGLKVLLETGRDSHLVADKAGLITRQQSASA